MRKAIRTNENPSGGSHRALGCGLNHPMKEIHMPKIRPIRRAFNHADLPLFRFALERADNRRLHHSARWVRNRFRVKSATMALAIADLAGLKQWGGDDA